MIRYGAALTSKSRQWVRVPPLVAARELVAH
jgi:hypothetical protein